MGILRVNVSLNEPSYSPVLRTPKPLGASSAYANTPIVQRAVAQVSAGKMLGLGTDLFEFVR
jgi:hypothetical protein